MRPKPTDEREVPRRIPLADVLTPPASTLLRYYELRRALRERDEPHEDRNGY